MGIVTDSNILTQMKRAQGETNDRLDALLQAQNETNRLLELLLRTAQPGAPIAAPPP